MNDDNLLSLEIISVSPNVTITTPSGIWAKLRKAIEAQVKKDGIRQNHILPGQIEADVAKMAADYIYDDVAEFYYWIFDTEDEFNRYQYVATQPTIGKNFSDNNYKMLRSVVLPVVEDNLDAMRDANEITPEQDVAGLSDKITDALTAYIINWEDWFYERKIDDDIEAYYEYAAEHAEIYHYSDYADLTNLPGNNQYDTESDVPYLSEDDTI